MTINWNQSYIKCFTMEYKVHIIKNYNNKFTIGDEWYIPEITIYHLLKKSPSLTWKSKTEKKKTLQYPFHNSYLCFFFKQASLDMFNK